MKAPRVLVVDDDPGIRELIAMHCRQWGYQTETARDGEEGLVFFAGGGEPPRLIISDWVMPGISGPEFCEQVKAARDDGYYYFIMITGKTDVREKAEAFRSGVDDFLSKPLDWIELRARVEAGKKIVSFGESLRENEFRVRMQCYRALVQLAEKRDQETGTHLARIGEYVYRLANRLELPRRYVENLRVFSQFHDIGKVGIPDQILLAPRRLTPDEFEIMKTHTTLGWQILKDVETMELAAETALTHHEHYDGTGYPQSLKGEAIPISGRITAIADVYDALRSSRPYKEAWTRERAAEYIRSQGGSQFDPRLSKLFAEIESEFNTIFMEGK